jgi:predicted HicB family RNase H-like nuclease
MPKNKPTAKTKTAQLAIHVDPAQLAKWTSAAESDDRSLASWVRVRLTEAAELDPHGYSARLMVLKTKSDPK